MHRSEHHVKGKACPTLIHARPDRSAPVLNPEGAVGCHHVISASETFIPKSFERLYDPLNNRPPLRSREAHDTALPAHHVQLPNLPMPVSLGWCWRRVVTLIQAQSAANWAISSRFTWDMKEAALSEGSRTGRLTITTTSRTRPTRQVPPPQRQHCRLRMLYHATASVPWRYSTATAVDEGARPSQPVPINGGTGVLRSSSAVAGRGGVPLHSDVRPQEPLKKFFMRSPHAQGERTDDA